MVSLPWSSCRILLEGEPLEDENGLPTGIVGRLYVTRPSQPAAQLAFSPFEPRRVSLLSLGLQQVANEKGPDALVGVIPGDSPHSIRMRELAQSCYDAKECLVCTNNWADIVLVPRSPGVAHDDSFAFLVFATNLKAAEVCDIVRHQAKVLVVLDLDNTLVDACAVAVTQKDWDALHWQPCTVTTESGRELAAQYAMLMEHDPHAEAMYIMHWRLGKLCCTFRVCIRRGWERLRDFLVRERARYEVFVCSKGKQEYVQLLWHMLDPLSQLFPTTDWDWRLNSTFPDAVPRAVQKTMLSAVGCVHPLDDAAITQLAAPVMCFDDCPNAYRGEYLSNVMYVEEYRPSDLFTADTGSVLRQVEQRLKEFWAANYAQPPGEGEAGGPWDRAMEGMVEVMHDMLGEPLRGPEDMREHAERCAALGGWLREVTSVRSVFGEQAFISDAPEALTPVAVPVEGASKDLAADTAIAVAAVEPSTPPTCGEAEHMGEAAAAAEGPELPCAAPLCLPGDPALADVSNDPAVTGGRRQYVAAESLLCALCKPGGACLPACPACAELAAASGLDIPAGPAAAQSGDRALDQDYEVLSTDGWNSPVSFCSTPARGARGGLEVLGGLGAAGGESYDSEEEREAASADVFQCVDDSLQQAARDVFHMRLARLSGSGAHGAMLMVPNARSVTGRLSLETGSLSLSSSPK